jgi:SAM-dependent methyltransferase
LSGGTEHAESVRERFARTAGELAKLEERRRPELREKLRQFVDLGGDERVLDAGTGTGALAFALAPLVARVVAVDIVPELLDEARKRTSEFPNVELVEGNATDLPFEAGSFDLAGSLRTLHHLARPELAIAELARVTRLGGQVLIIDQIAPADPLAALEIDRFERVRDRSHTRLLPDTDIRAFLEANGLVLERERLEVEVRDLEPYLDLAGCEGATRREAAALAPAGYAATIGWYLALKPAPRA